MADCRAARHFDDNAAGITTDSQARAEAALSARGTLQPIVFSLKKLTERRQRGEFRPRQISSFFITRFAEGPPLH